MSFPRSRRVSLAGLNRDASANAAAVASSHRSMENLRRAASCPAAATLVARSSSRTTLRMDAASASGLLSAATIPVTPSSTNSGRLPCGATTTGLPHSIASTTASPNPSLFDGCT